MMRLNSTGKITKAQIKQMLIEAATGIRIKIMILLKKAHDLGKGLSKSIILSIEPHAVIIKIDKACNTARP